MEEIEDFLLIPGSEDPFYKKLIAFAEKSDRVLSDTEKEYLANLKVAVSVGVSDFWVPKVAPSYNEEEGGLLFKKAAPIILDEGYDWWKEAAKGFAPEHSSKLATKEQFCLLAAWTVKGLMEHWGNSISEAWNAITNGSNQYFKSGKKFSGYSTPVSGVYDIANQSWYLDGKLVTGGAKKRTPLEWQLCKVAKLNSEEKISRPTTGLVVLNY